MGYYQATSMVVGCKNLYRIAEEEEEQVHITGKYNLVCDSNLEYFAFLGHEGVEQASVRRWGDGDGVKAVDLYVYTNNMNCFDLGHHHLPSQKHLMTPPPFKGLRLASWLL